MTFLSLEGVEPSIFNWSGDQKLKPSRPPPKPRERTRERNPNGNTEVVYTSTLTTVTSLVTFQSSAQDVETQSVLPTSNSSSDEEEVMDIETTTCMSEISASTAVVRDFCLLF